MIEQAQKINVMSRRDLAVWPDMARSALVLLLAGCVIVPKTETTAVHSEVQSEPVAGPPGPLTLGIDQIEKTYPEIVITTFHPQMCRQSVYGVTETTRHVGAKMAAGDIGNDPRGWLVLALLSPVTMAVSGLVTGIVVGARNGKRSLDKEFIKDLNYPCPVLTPHIAVKLQLPSGAILVGVTDGNATVHFMMPETEPSNGIVVASAAGVTPQLIQYDARAKPAQPVAVDPPKPDLSGGTGLALKLGDPRLPDGVRDVMLNCGVAHRMTGTVTVKLAIDGKGQVANVTPDRGTTELASCIGANLATTRFAEHHHGTTIEIAFDL